MRSVIGLLMRRKPVDFFDSTAPTTGFIHEIVALPVVSLAQLRFN